MKKSNFLKIGIGLFLSLLIFSCNDDDASLIVPEQLTKQDVVFNVNNFLLNDVSSKGLFSAKGNVEGEESLPDCSDKDPSYVEVTILGPDAVSTTYKLNLVTLNNKTETEVLKLTSGAYTITDFVVTDADGTVLWASPKEGSYYEQLWGLTGVDLPFTVPEFDKLKVSIDVLCYRPYDYEKFGFVWFKYAVTEIHTVCFYGDICTKFFEDWHQGTDGNPYLGQHFDGYDFPAIFSVVVKNAQGVVVNDPDKNSNASYQGKGSPLCIEYPDQVDVKGEIFTFEIYLTMPDGSDKLIYTGSFNDSAMSTNSGTANGFGGTDGIFDFVVGNCSYDGNDANIELPAYLPIPTKGKMTLSNGPFNASSYVDVTFSAIVNPTAEIFNGATLGAWCATEHDDIYLQTYDVLFYSSLEETLIPSIYQYIEWGSLNWIMNNLGTRTPQEIQEAIWQVTNSTDVAMGSPAATSLFAIEALTHTGFIPSVGDWAIVICDAVEAPQAARLQLLIVRVDP
jgi:hypothetical protein